MAKENLVELFVYSQNKTTKDGRKFKTYSTKAEFFMVNEDGKRTSELASRFIEVKFTDDAFENSSLALKDIKRGKLLVDGSYVGLPETYEIKIDENGKKIYPACWIRGGIKSFTPVEKQHVFRFVLEEDTNEVDLEETNE